MVQYRLYGTVTPEVVYPYKTPIKVEETIEDFLRRDPKSFVVKNLLGKQNNN